MNIKTFITTDGENALDFGSTKEKYYWCKNVGQTALYISDNANVKADGDGVALLNANEAVMIENYDNFIYVLGAGKIEVYETESETCPFKSSAQGGSGADEVARAAIEAHATNADIHLTAEQLSAGVAEAKTYADSKDEETLAAAKEYADSIAGSGGVSQSYVDEKDGETLAAAQTYADSAAQSAVTSANAYTEQYSAKSAHTHTVSDLTDFTEGVTEEQLNSAVDVKIDKIKTVSVMITTTGWLSDDDSKYPFYYDIPAPEATAYDRADVRIMPNSIEAARTAGFDTKTDTREGYIRIRAKQAPTAVISAEYQIFGGAV